MPRVGLRAMRDAMVLAAILVASSGALAVEPPQPNQSSTIMGPSNPQLADGATALDAGRVEEWHLSLVPVSCTTKTQRTQRGLDIVSFVPLW